MVAPWVSKEIKLCIKTDFRKPPNAIVIMDNASWYAYDIGNEFNNVSVIKLPLNPIEQVWSGLRQHFLANQSFNDYDDIVSQVCRAWNVFLKCSDRVTRICSRDLIELIS
ncbi:hypothetical protein L4C39_19690 [Vibrio clamense]|uniref:hypothetical protein n=1 Tax=Vibrio clamense TaxID=2910254 RepID=UPI003D25DACF